MNILSLFSGGGIGESRLEEAGFKVICGVELIESRCDFFASIHNADLINGDLRHKNTKEKVYSLSKSKNIDVIMATPPCQGMSIAGNMKFDDVRNTLIFDAVDIIRKIKPKYVFLENVPRQLSTYVNYNNKVIKIPQYIHTSLQDLYNFNKDMIIKSMDYGVPQMRKRNIMLLTRKDQKVIWGFPKPLDSFVSLKDAISHLPSIDPMLKEGEKETLRLFPNFKHKEKEGLKFSSWHRPPTHNLKHVTTMQKTPSGCTAFDNEIYYPKKDDGSRVKGHYNHYRRLSWDKPSRSLTQNNGVISSLACVHPGRLIKKGNEEEREYSDARCFTMEELFIVSSITFQKKLPLSTDDRLIRKIIGEGIPPLLVKKIFEMLPNSQL
jgi:DNA (cytosine-5)-methyltransferase 1